MDRQDRKSPSGARPPLSEGAASGQPSSSGKADLDEICRRLKDPRTDRGTISAIAEERRWQGYYKVRTTVVFRPDAPLAISLRFLTTLWWRDLARVIDDLRLPSPVRARAEQLLSAKMEEMTWGEKTALARIASRTVIKGFRDPRHPPLVRALLGNPHLYEEDVVDMAKNARSPASVLSVIARSVRWGDRYPVKMALAQNPTCPPQDALRALRGLDPSDLKRIAANERASRLVRIGASRRLDGRR